jgi:maltooligosyltrehalose trehalohydrolase
MGQEYGETAPFLYFVSHSDTDLVQAVRDGRKREFAAFAWRGEVPDPQAEETFLRSKLNHELRKGGWHASLLRFYKRLLELRRETPALRSLDRERTSVDVCGSGHTILMRRTDSSGRDVVCAFHAGSTAEDVKLSGVSGAWTKLLDSSQEEWNGPGSEVPAHLQGRAEVQLTLRPKQCIAMVST